MGYETLTFSCLMKISQLLPKIRASVEEIIKVSADLIINCIELILAGGEYMAYMELFFAWFT